MKMERWILGSVTIVGLMVLVVGCQGTHCQKSNTIKRVGMVIGLKEDKIEEYKRLHADDNPGVRDLLTKYHLHNFNIFLKKMPDGKYYEFGYYEYTGDDFKDDMAKLAAEQRNIDWLKICDPMQTPLPGEDGWAEMEQVYFNP
jgi:L-rhamnose mutarotase